MSDNNPTPRLDDQLCFALHAASRAMTRAYRPILSKLGVTYTQYITLMVLWETDGVVVRELGDRLRLDSGTLTPLLKRLERDGLVTRQRDLEDERQVRVFLTQEGQRLRENAADIQREITCRLSGDVDDLAALRTQLITLVDVLNRV